MSLTVAPFIITCALCYGIFYIVRWHMRRRRLYELASKFEGPPALPIIGNAHTLVGNTEYILIKTDELVNSYPSPCRMWYGPILALIVTDPDQLKVICLSPKVLSKSALVEDNARPLFGTGLLTAPVSIWKENRKLIQPTFNTKILDSFVEVFAAQTEIFTEQIERNLDGPEFKVFELLTFCTLDMICETAMGVKVGAQTDGDSEYVEAMQEIFYSMIKRSFYFWLRPDFIFKRTKLGRDQQRYIKYLHDFTENVIKMKKQEYLKRDSQPGADDYEDDKCDSKRRKETFLDLLMKMIYVHGTWSDQALRDEVITMVLTGNDTTANTISFTMLMLASHPDIQEKVYQELWEIFGDTDGKERPVTPKDLTRMAYLERVIKETLRIFPPGPYIYREVTDELDIDERTVPIGSFIVMGIVNLHRNEKYWPDPFKFDPDRFLPEENAKRHPYAYIPFSAGPRNCIGLRYAMMSMQTILATILRRYILRKDNIVPIKDIRLKYEILLRTVDPIKLRIERRTKAEVN